MSEISLFTVIAYDVANDKRRRLLIKVLESFGERAQESVFEAWLTPTERRKLEAKALYCIDQLEDRLAIYELPKIDRQDIIIMGNGDLAQDFTHWQL